MDQATHNKIVSFIWGIADDVHYPLRRRQYAGTIGRDILWPLAALNFGIEDRRRAPRFFLDTGDAPDLKYLADTLPTFVDMGAKIPKWAQALSRRRVISR